MAFLEGWLQRCSLQWEGGRERIRSRVQEHGGEGGGDHGCFGKEHDLLKDLAYFSFSVLLLDSSVEQCACFVSVSARSRVFL